MPRRSSSGHVLMDINALVVCPDRLVAIFGKPGPPRPTTSGLAFADSPGQIAPSFPATRDFDGRFASIRIVPGGRRRRDRRCDPARLRAAPRPRESRGVRRDVRSLRRCPRGPSWRGDARQFGILPRPGGHHAAAYRATRLQHRRGGSRLGPTRRGSIVMSAAVRPGSMMRNHLPASRPGCGGTTWSRRSLNAASAQCRPAG
ncbi:hypothetical protein LCGC14_0271630 [marine sediment metagenome]|uniref:Uncharacterized protein n=1 Tax=marine sediment metagenome TaxID=412755 RepID=A0A0F9WJG4_9ZZZZ